MFSPVRSNGNVTDASPKAVFPAAPPEVPDVAFVSDGAVNVLTASAGGVAGPPKTNCSGDSAPPEGPVLRTMSKVADVSAPGVPSAFRDWYSNVTPPKEKVIVSLTNESPG